MIEIRPISRAGAARFVYDHHRHNPIAPRSWLFGCSAYVDDVLVGVAMAGRPIARALDNGTTVEISRTCTDGSRNVNSALYARILRAARALGYRRAITYTTPEESGSSLRAVGFEIESTGRVRSPGDRGWESRPKQLDLLGTPHRPDGPKIRWSIDL